MKRPALDAGLEIIPYFASTRKARTSQTGLVTREQRVGLQQHERIFVIEIDVEVAQELITDETVLIFALEIGDGADDVVDAEVVKASAGDEMLDGRGLQLERAADAFGGDERIIRLVGDRVAHGRQFSRVLFRKTLKEHDERRARVDDEIVSARTAERCADGRHSIVEFE